MPNPPATVKPADAIFFPGRPNLRLDERQYSPELQRKLVETAAHTKSFVLAAKMAQVWSGQAFSERQIGRLTEAIGQELVEQRDAAADDWVHHRCEPTVPDPVHELVVVSVDGGRVQTREEIRGRGPGVHEAHWREDKIARLQTMTSTTYTVDPCPEPPACFLDTAKLQKFVDAAATTPETPDATPDAAANTPPADTPAVERWQPEPLVRTCVATMRPIDAFRWLVSAEAKRRHFFTALKRAFVGDGQSCNWTLHERHFPDFTPIIDFLHVAGYLFAAAKALGRAQSLTNATIVTQYRTWVRECWQGRAEAVCQQFRSALDAADIGADVLPDDHVLRPVQEAATYLTNHQDKMKYPEYRCQGLPTTSSLIESQIKEFNYRVKGSEKFWNEDNAEAILQVIAQCLRDDGHDLAGYMATRPGHVYRRRSTQSTKTNASTNAA